MAEETTTAPVQTEPVQQAASVDTAGQQGLPDPFDETSWAPDAPAVEQPAAAPAAQPAAAATPAAPAAPAPPASQDEELDEVEYLKGLGFSDYKTAQAEIARLRELEKQAPTRAGKEAVHKAITEKEEDIYNYLNNKRQLNAIQNLDLSTADSAARILKMNMQFKHKDLTPDDIDFAINSKYPMPPKPEQDDDETEGQYTQRVATWQQQVKNVERAMIIDAKLAKPDLLKYSSELTLPDIPIAPEAPAAPTAEEMQKAKEIQEQYFKAVEQGVSSLTGFEVEVDSDGAKLPIKYQASPEEKAKVKTIAESLFTGWDYMINRWSNADGTFNGAQIAKDVLYFESGGNIFQKMANESAAQADENRIKNRSNVQLEDGTQQRIIAPGAAKTEGELLAEQAYSDEKFV